MSAVSFQDRESKFAAKLTVAVRADSRRGVAAKGSEQRSRGNVVVVGLLGTSGSEIAVCRSSRMAIVTNSHFQEVIGENALATAAQFNLLCVDIGGP